MTETPVVRESERRPVWWRSVGPALITACVVFGPGSLLISANIGANHRYQLLWLLLLTGVLMGTYMTTAARIGVLGGATPCTLVAQRLGRPAAALIGINLCLICGTFQFSNNLAVAAAAGTLVPDLDARWVLLGFNGLIIVFLFAAKQIYRFLERAMKVMVGLMLLSFLFNVLFAGPSLWGIIKGLIPSWPEGISLGVPARVNGAIHDPMILVASLLGTTFSVAAAFYQGNLVREKGWTIGDYRRGIGDSITGVCVLTGISAIIMITAATVIPGKPAEDIGVLAESLRPLLGSFAHAVFCIGLFAVAMNPFLINAMIGGSILADGIGRPSKLGDRWPRRFTVVVLLAGMIVAMLALRTGHKPVTLIIFGQALTVIGNPLMAVTILWLANRKDVMGSRRNSMLMNILGGVGLLVVLLMAIRVLILVVLKLS
ncbi:MAG TPA: divalent metal cation transporter [Sedimentisphaerales bacterium]|jgi:manganese transport protein|nr:divalent metal cation transporter [Sedimentisphaerales bacterium]